MTRIVMVPAGEEAPEHESTVVLGRYPSGEILVSTEAPAAEVERLEREAQPARGLALSNVGPQTVDKAVISVFEETDDEFLGFLVLAGPTADGWMAGIEAAGLAILRFQPHSAYLCRGTGPKFAIAAKLPFVQSVVRLDASLKPRETLNETGDTSVWIVVEGSVDAVQARREIEGMDDVRIEGSIDRTRTQLRFPALVCEASVAVVLRHPFVLSVELRHPVVPEDEVACLVLSGNYNALGRPSGQYLQWLEDHGVNGRDVCIGIVDNGVDETHEAFSSRITAKDSGRRWHGTFVAGHAGGCYLAERDSDGFIYGLGMAPAVQMISQSNQNAVSFNCDETVTTSGPGGALGTIQNNSWGVGTTNPMDYRSMEASYDELVRDASAAYSSKPLTICFSAGNSGTSGLTRPKAAKNVLVTGNSENYRPSVGLSDSDNINEVYTGSHASSHGNCGDGRVRPHVVAPGEWTASANYDSHPGQAEFISPKLTWGGGTSGASPKTAGACALLTQWWRAHNGGATPSPALLRAIVVNSAEDTSFGGPIPNPQQGWGRLNIANALSTAVHHLYVDQSSMLRHRGEERTWQVRITDPTKPLRVTLAWTDPPGGLNTGTRSVPAVVNFLGLRVETNGQTYYGNKFANGMSIAGPLAEPGKEGWDNLQNVYLPPGSYGSTVAIRVRALNITTDCLGNSSGNPQQDFALVITNGYIDGNSCPSDMFIAIDDVSGGSGSGIEDYWHRGSGDDDEADADWWTDIDSRDHPTLRQGESGDLVRGLQGLLVQLGYLGDAIDGSFGSRTAAAVRAFQAAEALDVDGIVGGRTWEALYRAAGRTGSGGTGTDAEPHSAERPTLRRGDGGEHVRELQRLLTATGYLDERGTDEDFGPGTQAAVIRFQKDEGLSADGVVGAATWSALLDAAGERTGSVDGGAVSAVSDLSNDDELWGDDFWSDDEDTWWESSGPASESARDQVSFAAEAIGRSLLASVGHEGSGFRMMTGGVALAEVGGEAGLHADTVENAGLDLIERARTQAVVPLSRALGRLMARWDDFGAPNERGLSRRRVAVVVVGARTRVSRRDLRAMRRLALHGDLYVVSAHGPILGFLAQRLHMTRGVHFRRARAEGLEETIRAVTTEATGAQSLVVRSGSKQSEGRLLHRLGFHLNELDHRAVIEVRGEPGVEFLVKPPGGEPHPVTTQTRGVRLASVSGGFRLEFIERGEGNPWGGGWTIMARGSQTLTAEGWVWSDLDLRLQERGGTMVESSREGCEDNLMTLRGFGGAKLGSMRVSGRDVVDDTESSRAPIDVRACRSRLVGEAGGALSETGQAAAAPMSEVLDARFSNSAEERPRVLEVQVEAVGVSPAGGRFYRGVRGNMLGLVSRRRWRRGRRRSEAARQQMVEARIVAIRSSQTSAIAGLLLERADGRRRGVRVDDPVLRELLMEAYLARGILYFQIHGNVVLKVVRMLPEGQD